MTLKERTGLMKQTFANCLQIAEKKGLDYSGEEDANSNFKRNAERLNLTKYQIWAIYFNKHIDAILNSIATNPDAPRRNSESLNDSINDSINYLTILKSMLVDDKKEKTLIPQIEINDIEDFENLIPVIMKSMKF